MRHTVYLLVFLAGLLAAACHPAPLQPWEPPIPGQKSGVALHLLTSPASLGNDPAALDTAALRLAESPLLDYTAIERYTATTYTFWLTDAAAAQLKQLSTTLPLAGKPFALVVDGTPVYYGSFWNPVSSLASVYPLITLDQTGDHKALTVYLMKLAPGGPAMADPRNDSRLLDRLRKDNKLR